MFNDPTPIPPSAERALDAIEAAAGGPGPEHTIPRDEAVEVLIDNDFTEQSANDTIDLLLSRGYLYGVDDTLRVTPD